MEKKFVKLKNYILPKIDSYRLLVILYLHEIFRNFYEIFREKIEVIFEDFLSFETWIYSSIDVTVKCLAI